MVMTTGFPGGFCVLEGGGELSGIGGMSCCATGACNFFFWGGEGGGGLSGQF